MRFILIFLFFSLSVTLAKVHAQETCTIIQKAESVLRDRHVSPLSYNDEVYHQVVNLYLETLDDERVIFCSTDSLSIHAGMKGATSLCQVFQSTLPMIRQCLQRHDSLLKALSLPYLTSTKTSETFLIPCEQSMHWQSDVKTLLTYDKKLFKYAFIEKQYVVKQAGVVMEPERILRSLVQKRSAYLAKLLQNDHALLSVFLKGVALRHDPHSLFLDASEKEEWMTSLAKEELTFGFQLEIAEDETYKVGELIPGGAAWNSRQMEAGDRIDQVELENGRKYFPGIDPDEEIVDALSSKNNLSVTFYLTQPDGNKVQVKLTKSKSAVTSNVVTGYIFENDGLKLGYIDLPSFYATEYMTGGGGCANDLAREILQLKKDGINGLIIDLRGNGGGYLHEALAVAGLFIDEGVLALKQERGDKPRYLKDPNRGTVYDGKLMVLINAYSASASELLSGTLQHYHRAIIAGSSSFGKATMQQFLPVDSMAELKGTNTYYLNVTIGKFYMIDKGTHQGKGIVPDIALPGVHDYLDIPKESDMPYYLPSDSVQKALSVVIPPPIRYAELKAKSEKRMAEAGWIPKIKGLADSLNYYRCYPQALPLSEKSISDFNAQAERFVQSMNDHQVVPFKAYPVRNTSVFDQVLQEHDMYRRPNELKKEELSEDLRLYEALNILTDYIRQSK